MLTSFSVTNFKSYESATLPLSELTVLIGANASGKSNLIEAMQLLSWLAHGRRLGDLLYAMEKRDLLARGVPDDYLGDKSLPFSLKADLNGNGQKKHFDLSLVETIGGIRIANESLIVPALGSDVPLYRVEALPSEGSSDLSVSYNNFKKGGIKPRISCSDQQLLLTQLLTPARFGNDHERSQSEIPKICAEAQRSFEQMFLLDPVPSLMRGYSFPTDPILRGDGSNLSGVLKRLCGNEKNAQRLLGFVRDLPEQDITGIDFIETPRKEYMVKLTETFSGEPREVLAALLSDGTLRVLAIAAALLSAPEGSLVVIEEVDNGIHPSRAESLLAGLRRISEERSLRVLLTTHNPALLDALPLEAIPDVVFCYRNPTSGASELVRLQDLENYPELVAQGRIGALLTRRVLDRFVKQPRSAEARRKQAQMAFSLLEDEQA